MNITPTKRVINASNNKNAYEAIRSEKKSHYYDDDLLYTACDDDCSDVVKLTIFP
jgi:hypothetical protein